MLSIYLIFCCNLAISKNSWININNFKFNFIEGSAPDPAEIMFNIRLSGTLLNVGWGPADKWRLHLCYIWCILYTNCSYIFTIFSTKKFLYSYILVGHWQWAPCSKQPSTKSFFNFSDIRCVGRGWCMTVWPDSRTQSRSRALDSRKFGQYLKLVGAGFFILS